MLPTIQQIQSTAHAYGLSFAARRVIESPATTVLADGMGCRIPQPEVLDVLLKNVDHIVEVTDGEIAEAMRLLYESTHNLAEGAGAAAIAAIMKERELLGSDRVAAILSGGNVDRNLFADVLSNSFA